MPSSPDQIFHQAVTILTKGHPHRVWSLIVTLFGDLAQTEALSGAVLSKVTEPIGIKPEALRVALHRLRKDGWLESRKSGRTSDYVLTAMGRKISAAATPRIYAREPDSPNMWHVLISGPQDMAERQEAEKLWRDRGYIPVGNGAFLGKGTATATGADLLVVEGHIGDIPEWLRHMIGTQELADAYQELADILNRLSKIIGSEPEFSPLQVATLRTLLVHSWRRVVLRHPDLPLIFFPEGWQGENCRALTMEMLDILPRPQVSALTAAVS